MCEHLNEKIDSAGILSHYIGHNPYPSSKQCTDSQYINRKKRASQINLPGKNPESPSAI